jgi:hypothetical protein
MDHPLGMMGYTDRPPPTYHLGEDRILGKEVTKRNIRAICSDIGGFTMEECVGRMTLAQLHVMAVLLNVPTIISFNETVGKYVKPKTKENIKEQVIAALNDFITAQPEPTHAQRDGHAVLGLRGGEPPSISPLLALSAPNATVLGFAIGWGNQQRQQQTQTHRDI